MRSHQYRPIGIPAPSLSAIIESPRRAAACSLLCLPRHYLRLPLEREDRDVPVVTLPRQPNKEPPDRGLRRNGAFLLLVQLDLIGLCVTRRRVGYDLGENHINSARVNRLGVLVVRVCDGNKALPHLLDRDRRVDLNHPLHDVLGREDGSRAIDPRPFDPELPRSSIPSAVLLLFHH